MGVINETLKLTDHFSAAFQTFIQMGSRSASTAETLRESTDQYARTSQYAAQQLDALKGVLASQESLYAAQGQRLDAQRQKVAELAARHTKLAASKGMEAGVTTRAAEALARAQIQEQRMLHAALKTSEAMERQNTEILKFTDRMGGASSTVEQTVRKQKQHTEEVERTSRASGKLLKATTLIAAAAGAARLVKSFLDFSDTQAQITARLNLMNDGLQETSALNEMIFQSSLRSRASYLDTADAIAKMGVNAGNAFSSNTELIAFMEQVNKQFAIGGATAQEQKNAMVQLTQAMAAGALRGEELNSILDAAPGIARTIEQSMGWAEGSIKKYAEKGMVSAGVVKNSLLSMADETNAKFQSMPMTVSQAMTMMESIVQHSVSGMAAEWNEFFNSAEGQELLMGAISLVSILAETGVAALSALGQGAMFVADNLDFILPVLAAVALGLAVLHRQAILAGIASVGSTLASAAGWAVAHWPLLLLIAVLASAMIAAQQFGAGMAEVCGWVGQVLGMLYAIGYNVFASLWNVIAAFAEFFANVWNDPLGATARLFFDIFDTILGIVETTAGAIDALLGTSLAGTVAGFRGKLSGWVDDTFGENAIQIKRMAELDVYSTSQSWGQKGENLGTRLDNLNLNLEDLTGGLGGLLDGFTPGAIDNVGTVGKVKKVDDIRLSDEDLKIYRDLAERRYMNKIELKTVAPQISVTIPPSAGGNLTAEDVTEHIRKMLVEEMNSQTAVSHG